MSLTRYKLPESLKQLAFSGIDTHLHHATNKDHHLILLHVYKRFQRLTKLINFNKTNMRNDYRIRKNYKYYLQVKFRKENYPLKRNIALELNTNTIADVDLQHPVKIDANVLINTYNFMLKGIRCIFLEKSETHTLIREDDLCCKRIVKNIMNMQYEKFKLYHQPQGGASSLSSSSHSSSSSSSSFVPLSSSFTGSSVMGLPAKITKKSKETILKNFEIEKNLHENYNYLIIPHSQALDTQSIKNSECLKFLNVATFDRNLTYLNECLNTQL